MFYQHWDWPECLMSKIQTGLKIQLHIGVNVIIGPRNGLAPIHFLNQCWLYIEKKPRNYLRWNSCPILRISLRKIEMKLSFVFCCQFSQWVKTVLNGWHRTFKSFCVTLSSRAFIFVVVFASFVCVNWSPHPKNMPLCARTGPVQARYWQLKACLQGIRVYIYSTINIHKFLVFLFCIGLMGDWKKHPKNIKMNRRTNALLNTHTLKQIT